MRKREAKETVATIELSEIVKEVTQCLLRMILKQARSSPAQGRAVS
jgi:hypothetical protein